MNMIWSLYGVIIPMTTREISATREQKRPTCTNTAAAAQKSHSGEKNMPQEKDNNFVSYIIFQKLWGCEKAHFDINSLASSR